MTKRSGPNNLKPIPAELVAQWGEGFPIQEAVRGKRWRWERFTVQICRRCDLSTYPGIKAIGACDPKREERR